MLKKGNIVVYKNQPAIITEIGEKYTIQFANGSQKVREKDIVLLHEGSLASLSQLEQSSQDKTFQPQQLKNQLDETWELLQDENKNTFSLSAIAEIALGKFPVEKAWLFYSAVLSHTRFISCSLQPPEIPLFSLRTAEESESFAAKEAAKEQEAKQRQIFIERLRQKKLILPDDGIFMAEVEALALGKTDKSKIMKDAGFSVSPEKAHKLLLDTGVWTLSRNPHPARWGLSMQSANERLSRPPEEERLFITCPAYAIDNSWSADPDDAIGFDGFYIWVHIADPASTVTPDSSIDRVARNRGATLYIPEGAARMLAEESLSDYALGLREVHNPPEASRALSFRIRLDDTGTIIETAVFKTLVQVKRLTYEEADALQKTPEFSVLFAIAQKNIERRKAAGAVFIDLPEVHISVCDGIPAISPAEQTESSALVREFMLLAGEAAARYAFKNNIAFPFVSQEKPEIPKDLPPAIAGQYRLRRSMKGRNVGIRPAVHSGLGLGMYSQVSSPLRRYSDLIAHQQLRAFIDGKPLLDQDSMLERIGAGDAAAGAAVKVERKSNLHWTLVYLFQNPSWQGEAIIVDIRGNQAQVLIPSIGQESLIALPPNAELNQRILVCAKNINIPEQTVTFIAVK